MTAQSHSSIECAGLDATIGRDQAGLIYHDQAGLRMTRQDQAGPGRTGQDRASTAFVEQKSKKKKNITERRVALAHRGALGSFIRSRWLLLIHTTPCLLLERHGDQAIGMVTHLLGV